MGDYQYKAIAQGSMLTNFFDKNIVDAIELMRSTSVEQDNNQLYGIYDALETMYYQASHLLNYHNELYQSIPDGIISDSIHAQPRKALADFEGLLYFSRSALDRATYFLTEHFYKGTKADKIDKLKAVFIKNQNGCEHSLMAIDIINEAFPSIEKLLINEENGQFNLRSYLAHKRTTYEIDTEPFPIYRNQDFLLRLDGTIHGYPIFNTTREIMKSVTYLIVNLVSIHVGIIKKPIKKSKFSVIWNSRFIDSKKYVANADSKKTIKLLCTTSDKKNLYSKEVDFDVSILKHVEKIT